MDLSELIVMLHHEVQKSYDFIDAAAKINTPGVPVIHISLEKMEVEVPVAVSERRSTFKYENFKGEPLHIQNFRLPYSAEVFKKIPIQRPENMEVIKGKSVSVEILGPEDQKAENLVKEFVGRMRITLKPIIK
jgi:hypothetical protein